MFVLSFSLLCLVPLVFSQTFPFVDISTCQPDQFFNSANQQCESCTTYVADTEVTSSALECICTSGLTTQFSEIASTTITEYFSCIDCTTTPANPVCIADSLSCSANQALVETYMNGAILLSKSCINCSSLITPSSQSIVCDYNAPVNVASISIPATDPLYVQQQLPAAQAGCQYSVSPNITACQVLGNLCVLQFYDSSATACIAYRDIFIVRDDVLNGIESWQRNLPMIYYTTVDFESNLIDAGSILGSSDITSTYAFRGGDTLLDLVLMKYDFNGTFLGSESAVNGALQLCPDRPAVESRAFVFGTVFRQACQLSSAELGDQSKYPSVMYDLNLRFTDSSGTAQLFPIPIGVNVATLSGEFVRRFVLVDRESLASSQMIRYASSVSISVNLRNVETGGLINPPAVQIIYGTISTTATATVPASFSIDYFKSFDLRAFQIAIPVIAALGLLYALSETSSWRRRQGLHYLDGSSLLMFLYFSLGMLANAFFVVMFGYAVITLLFYRNQTVVTTIPPNEEQRELFVIITSIAFAFKALEVLGIIFFQCSCDIFLIDWEHPHVEGDGKVSIWRTFFIANEWNEIQTCRKIRFTFQLLVVLLFLEVIGYKSLALENPTGVLDQALSDSPDNPTLVYNPLLRFAIAGLIYVIVAVVQVLYQVLIHERFIHDQIREFIDLCSVSNISVFILANRNFGYYIHGRSVHGRADTDMLEMNYMLKKEEEHLTAGRGLETGADLQTFSIAVSSLFRGQYDKIYQPLEQVRSQPSARGLNTGAESLMSESVRAYSTMRDFLSSFIDHSLRDLDYTVKDRMFVESLLDMEFEEALNTCYFYKDPQISFTNNLFYGKEFSLLMFDLLLFTIIDYHVFNYVLAALITFLVGKFLEFLRQSISRSNLAKKTLVDKRFLI